MVSTCPLISNYFSLFTNPTESITIGNYYFTLLESFHTSVSRCFPTGVWVTASFLKSLRLLSILVDLNNVVVWMVSTRSLISKTSSPYSNPLVTVSSAPITIGITVTFMFRSFFSSQEILSTYFTFRFLSVLPFGQPERQNLLFDRFSFLFFVDNHKVWSSSWD